ncbi:hypothetical protein C1646_767971 [Rhizophagus diaphanus]|nr:hypothetical protein C1646_767971 [Rhizophagus diaphanus] [Rhizophagus sp. MUCL 43196]
MFSPPLSPLFVDLIDEDIDEINSEHERISLKFNEMLAYINDDTDNTSISSIDFEDFESEVEEQEICNEKDEIIDNLEQLRFTLCVIIDFIEGKFQRCEKTGNLRQLHNLFGVWQVDRDAVKGVDGILSKLGVCDSHFQFDNKGTGCAIHSWHLNKRNIQVPCIGQYSCEALQSCPPLCKQAFENIKNPKCICCLCYENLGGHIHHRSGIRGKSAVTCITEKLHEDDITKGLEFMGNLLIKIAQTGNNEIKKNILIKTFEILLPLTSMTSISTADTSIDREKYENIILKNPSSLFMIKVLFIKIFKEKEIKKNIEINDFEELGRIFGQKLWNSRANINLKKSAIESPQTIQEYYNAFPEFLNNFFFGMIDELYQKKIIICNMQRKKCQKSPKIIIPEQTTKIVTFITSILLNLAFPYLKVWLPQILASLSRMPRLLGYFRQLLTVCHVTSHTDRHERKLAKIRIEASNPVERLIKENNIWNIAIIDNIDFKEKSFKFGNIYDVTRGSSHATLRMAFQVQLPIEVETDPEQIIELTAETPLFGMNQNIDNTLTIFQQIIYELLDFKKINEELIYKTNFNAETIKRSIFTKLNCGCSGPSPNVVILEPGSNPNSDEEILRVAEMYKEDFAMSSHSFLNIVADEAIFRRLIKCREKWPHIRPLLGQWHTSKDFCSVLLVLFSSYGLLSLASRLGVHFLDKFESAVDYRSTARVLDLIWVAVGIAINIFIVKKEILFSEIMDSEENNYGLKV